ncbi:hypothetical protein [Noviherbaspirillum pedocola]|uniref:Uncharacterized protein n=1 Tax=Noviherbaspirillum pedocola TaxID=2801341 RepID=A0A934SNY7_9BURK|nr:hypothetical protein [Noviherbaspirillum pedocola]MBK4733935.1 hypothetical protein [Noviherbaspirillum pedocola]
MSVNSPAHSTSSTPQTSTFSISTCPDDILVNISLRVVTPETFHPPGFWLTDKTTADKFFGSTNLIAKAMPDQLAYRNLRSIDVEDRPKVAAKFLLSLKPTLRPVYVPRVLVTIPENEESGVPLNGMATRGAVAACLLAPGHAADGDSDKAAKEMLNVMEWNAYIDIPGMPSYAIKTFKGDQELIDTALAGLWNVVLSVGRSNPWNGLFAYATCETMLKNTQTSNVTLLVRIVTDPSLATQTKQFDALGALESSDREEQFNWLIGGLSLLEERSGEEVLQYLSCLAPLLPQNGNRESAAADWLSASIALAVRKGVDVKQIQDAIPADRFSDRFVKGAIRHAFTDHAASAAQKPHDAGGKPVQQ